MFRILAIGLVIYLIWKLAEGYFNGPKNPPNSGNNGGSKPEKDGFTDYEELK